MFEIDNHVRVGALLPQGALHAGARVLAGAHHRRHLPHLSADVLLRLDTLIVVVVIVHRASLSGPARRQQHNSTEHNISSTPRSHHTPQHQRDSDLEQLN